MFRSAPNASLIIQVLCANKSLCCLYVVVRMEA